MIETNTGNKSSLAETELAFSQNRTFHPKVSDGLESHGFKHAGELLSDLGVLKRLKEEDFKGPVLFYWH